MAGGLFVAASGQIQAITMLWMSQPTNATTITRRERDLAGVRAMMPPRRAGSGNDMMTETGHGLSIASICRFAGPNRPDD